MCEGEVRIAYADRDDLEDIKRIADQSRNELGFVIRAAIQEAILDKRILVCRAHKHRLCGFVHFRHRLDRCTKIYQLCLIPPCQRKGWGRNLILALIDLARERCQLSIALRCPDDLPANDFYRAIGFQLESSAEG